MAITEILPHVDLLLPAWSDLWQSSDYATLNSGTKKVFGLTTKVVDASYTQLFNKVTHMQISGTIVENAPSSKIWINGRYYFGDTITDMVNRVPNDPNCLVMAQIREDGGSESQINQFYEALYNRLVTNFGVTSPNQTNLIDDYFGPTFSGTNIDIKVPEAGSSNNYAWSVIRSLFANQSVARQKLNSYDGSWSTMGQTGYYTEGLYQYRNWFTEGYLHDFWFTKDGQRTYNLILNLERMALAFPDRKRITYGWSIFDNVKSELYASMSFNRLRFEDPAGDILPQNFPPIPPSIMECEAFFSSLVGDGYILWDVFSNAKSDIDYWQFGWFGESSTFWQADGSGIVPWDGTPPYLNVDPLYLNYPLGGNQAIAIQGLAKGRYKYDLIEDAIKTLVYATFSYTINGGSVQSGYYDGNTPELGTLGDASVSRMNNANYGQTNAARSCQNKKPLLMYGTNSDTGKKCLIWYMPYIDYPTDVFTVTFTNGAGGTFTTSEGLHVFEVT